MESTRGLLSSHVWPYGPFELGYVPLALVTSTYAATAAAVAFRCRAAE